MGKATIYSHLGDGLYSILYTPDLSEIDARVTALETQKTALDTQLYSENGLVEGRSAAEAVYQTATDAFQAALADWSACAMSLPPCPDQATLMQAVVARGKARAEAGAALNTIKAAIAANRAQYYAVTQEIAYLGNTSGAIVMQASTIDYNPDAIIPADTEVGTVETFGAKGGYAGGWLPRKWVNIQSSVSPFYLASRDHCVKPLSGIKTAAMFFNWCQWLYVMSRNPQYAVGVVQSKFDPDQTYLDVVLYGTTPGAVQPGGYPFVPGESSVTLLNLPVNYLSCGALAFEAGDDVIVRFGAVNRGSPMVIGFAQNPRICLPACHEDWPYHGLVKNGYMALPNSTARIVGQPASGDVITCQIPGHTAPERTEAEVIADTAAGMVWHDYKTFAGSSRIYNQSCSLGNINTWVWAPSSSEHWRARLYPAATIVTIDGVTTATLYIKLDQPDLLTDPDPATTEHTITISDELTGTWTDDFDGETVSSVLQVIDVSSDGGMALLAAKRRTMDHREGQRGFFLLTLTSTSTATLTVLADHETCNPSWPHTYYPWDGDYAEFGYSDIPVWMWFDAADAVEYIYFGINQHSTEAGDSMTVTLSVNSSVVSTYTASTSGGGVFDGDAIARLSGATGSAYGRSESGAEIYYVAEPQYNAHRWISFAYGFYAGIDLLPDENPSGGQMVIEPVVYSNKSVGLRLRMSHIIMSFSGVDTYILSDTYYGNIIHPAGPTDPGTWISADGSAPFTLYTPPTGVVHSEPSADYGSYNLQTGQLMRNQTVPVCYL